MLAARSIRRFCAQQRVVVPAHLSVLSSGSCFSSSTPNRKEITFSRSSNTSRNVIDSKNNGNFSKSRNPNELASDFTSNKLSNDPFHPSNVQPLETVMDVYRFAVTQLHQHNVDFGHTTTNAYEDASFLILHELALPNDSDIRNWYSAKLTAKEKDHLIKLLRRRCVDHVPSPYLAGGCYQQGLYFMVDERVLIPRSFIGEILFKWQKLLAAESEKESQNDSVPSLLSSPGEELVELDYNDYIGEIIDQDNASPAPVETKQPTKERKQKQNLLPIDAKKIRTVLDMCTGSGCLAILAAKFLPNVEHVDAVDLSSDALNVAEENVESHGLDDILDLHQGDLFEALPDSRKGYYNLIVSNPPYVTKSDMEALPEEYRKEPKMALVAGAEGIDIVERILHQAAQYLRPGGYLLCEIGQTADALEQKYGSFFSSARTYTATDDWMKSKLMCEVTNTSDMEEAASVLWIDTELSKREVFLASKKCLEALAPKIKLSSSSPKKTSSKK